MCWDHTPRAGPGALKPWVWVSPRTFQLGPLVKSLVPFVDGEEAQGR